MNIFKYFKRNINTCNDMKKKLTLSIDEEIIQKAKKSGVNISQTVENFLKFGDAFGAGNWGSNPHGSVRSKSLYNIKKSELMQYVSEIKLSGITDLWIKQLKSYILEYLKFCNWSVNKDKTLAFLQKIQKENGQSTYRKKVLQIRKFLQYLDLDYLDKLKVISEPNYTPKRISKEDIKATIALFKDTKNYLQVKALVLLGASSGLRAEELYQLTINDIDLENRIVYVNHDINKEQSTKTGQSRISFFTKHAREALKQYLEDFNNSFRLDLLFGKHHLQHLFNKAPIQVKDLRKYFSQIWTRNNGNYAVKELLMGHSIKKSVDLQHYTVLSNEELKAVYDKTMK